MSVSDRTAASIEPCHPFRSADARDEYLGAYDQRARRWPIASDTTMAATTLGDTFVRVQGPLDGQPMVLLPGDSETSLSWSPVIEAFAADHRVYAVDHVYDVGRSIHRTRPRRPDDLVRWLDELFDELELHDVRLVGHSYGAWIASLYALDHPDRLDRLVLLSPPTVLRPPIGLVARAIVYGTIPRRSIIRRYLYWFAPECVRRDASTRAAIDEMVDDEVLARRCLTIKKRHIVRPTVLSDEDWKGLTVPTLYLVGRHEVSYSAERAVERFAAVAPEVRTAITDGDHHLTITHPGWVVDRVREFLVEDDHES